jgi:predicted ester cyclase
MSEANKRVSARLIDARNNWDEAVLDELLSPNWGYRRQGDATPAAIPAGPAGLIELWSHARGAFPNSHLTITEQIAEGERVVTLWDFVGRHEGPVELPGITAAGGATATGNEVRISGIVVDRFEDGKVIETIERADALGMLLQVGAISGVTRE